MATPRKNCRQTRRQERLQNCRQFCRQIFHRHKKRAAKLDKLEVLEVLEALKRGPEDLGTYGQSDQGPSVRKSYRPYVLLQTVSTARSPGSFSLSRARRHKVAITSRSESAWHLR
jgi:hypothetical protein